MQEDTYKPIHDIANSLSESDKAILLHALEVAGKAHAGQLRKSGDYYIEHPIAVSVNLWNKYHDVPLAVAALLHDTVEDDESTTIESIYNSFGETVGFIVDALNKKKATFYQHPTIVEDKIERLIWAGLKDVRCFLVKIADREHNINTLKHLKSNKQVRMAFETQAIFEPLKKVLHYNTNKTLRDAATNFHNCLVKHNIRQPDEIKKCLYSMSFRDFSHEMFDLVYNNSDTIVWEVEDKKYLESLLANEEFEDHVTIDRMWSDGKSFKAHFTFDKGYILDSDIGLRVSSYKK